MKVKWCFWTVVLEKTLESPSRVSKEIQLVHPKRNQFWIFIGRTDAEAETPILWPSDVKNRLIGKDPDAGKDWRQEEKGTSEDEMVWWHHQPYGHEFEYALGVGDGQGSLACCSPWVHRELDTTEQMNWTELKVTQLSTTLCEPMDCSPPGSTLHGILRERILERVAVPFSRGSSPPRDLTWVSCIAGRFFTIWSCKVPLLSAPYRWGNCSTKVLNYIMMLQK